MRENIMHNPDGKDQVWVESSARGGGPCYEATSQLAGEACVERIVVGTDLTERSSAAVSMAAELAAQLKATLHVVSTCPSPTVTMGPEVAVVPDHAEVVESAKGNLERIASDLRRQGLTVETHTPIGDAADGLCSVAEAIGADLIVVGNKRMHGVARLLGSVPNRVAHKATCSVLIARTG